MESRDSSVQRYSVINQIETEGAFFYQTLDFVFGAMSLIKCTSNLLLMFVNSHRT